MRVEPTSVTLRSVAAAPRSMSRFPRAVTADPPTTLISIVVVAPVTVTIAEPPTTLVVVVKM